MVQSMNNAKVKHYDPKIYSKEITVTDDKYQYHIKVFKKVWDDTLEKEFENVLAVETCDLSDVPLLAEVYNKSELYIRFKIDVEALRV